MCRSMVHLSWFTLNIYRDGKRSSILLGTIYSLKGGLKVNPEIVLEDVKLSTIVIVPSLMSLGFDYHNQYYIWELCLVNTVYI